MVDVVWWNCLPGWAGGFLMPCISGLALGAFEKQVVVVRTSMGKWSLSLIWAWLFVGGKLPDH